MENKNVWIITFVGENDVFVVSSAAKAYEMLKRYAIAYYADNWLIEELEMLKDGYERHPNNFGLIDMGFAIKQEIDDTEIFDWIIDNMNQKEN